MSKGSKAKVDHACNTSKPNRYGRQYLEGSKHTRSAVVVLEAAMPVVLSTVHRPFNLMMTDAEMVLLMGCLSETLEESVQAYDRDELRILVGLHRRFAVLTKIPQDYCFRDGSAVAARGGALIKSAVI